MLDEKIYQEMEFDTQSISREQLQHLELKELLPNQRGEVHLSFNSAGYVLESKQVIELKIYDDVTTLPPGTHFLPYGLFIHAYELYVMNASQCKVWAVNDSRRNVDWYIHILRKYTGHLVTYKDWKQGNNSVKSCNGFLGVQRPS